MNSIESMEKFFLGGIFTGQELDIVKEKGIDFTVFVFEFHGGFFSEYTNLLLKHLQVYPERNH